MGNNLKNKVVDLQVNGGAGVLFTADPSLSAAEKICAAHQELGTSGMFLTVISSGRETLRAAIEVARQGIGVVPGFMGLHVEGPFISPAKRGVHCEKFVRRMDDEDMDLLTSLPPGALVVTLAPEAVESAQIEQLADAGVTVSLGHTDATYEEAMRAFDAGASMVTHLFNAMSQMTGRCPGLVGAAMGREDVSCGIIVDGHHVHYGSVKAAYDAKGPMKLFLVSDAMPSVGCDTKSFELDDRVIDASTGVCRAADGTLAGSSISMNQAVWDCMSECGIPLHDIMLMVNPLHLLRK